MKIRIGLKTAVVLLINVFVAAVFACFSGSAEGLPAKIGGAYLLASTLAFLLAGYLALNNTEAIRKQVGP